MTSLLCSIGYHTDAIVALHPGATFVSKTVTVTAESNENINVATCKRCERIKLSFSPTIKLNIRKGV